MNTPAPIVSRLLTFKQLCDGRFFQVPDYQRGYAWEPSQVRDLLSDIERIDSSRSYRHFTGTIVLADPECVPPDRERLQVVDGQQRLTTIIMILARLFRLGKLSDESRQYILRTYLEHGEPRSAEPVLVLNRATNDHFRAYVLEGHPGTPDPSMVSHRRLRDAIDCIDKWLCSSSQDHEELLVRVTERLGFIIFKPDSIDEVGLMFEMINNRGKSLSELEKIKNYLIYYSVKAKAPKLRRDVDAAWSSILADLSLADGLQSPDEHLFMRSACITYFGFKKTESNAAYNALKKSFPIENADKKWQDLTDFIRFLQSAARHYKELRSDKDLARERLRGRRKVVDLLDLIGSQRSIASVLPCYFAVMALRDHDHIEDSQLERMLSIIEKLNFRVYLSYSAARRSDSGQGSLFDLAHRLYQLRNLNEVAQHEQSELSVVSEVEAAMQELIDFTLSYSSLTNFRNSFQLESDSPVNFGTWRSLKYFLMNYEQRFNERKSIRVRDVNLSVDESKPDDFPSTEHILARANQPEGMSHDQADWLKRRLGNFVLLELGVNKRARDKDIGEKVNIYSEVDGSQMRQVRQICKDYEQLVEGSSCNKAKAAETIVDKLIARHEQRLQEFAVERWSLPREDVTGKALDGPGYSLR